MAVLGLILWKLLTPSLPSGVVVRTAGECPSAAAVRAALASLLSPAQAQQTAGDVVEIEVDRSSLHASLRRPSGEVFLRELPAPSDCQARARAAAVVIGAWEAQFAEQPAKAWPAPATPTPVVPALRSPVAPTSAGSPAPTSAELAPLAPNATPAPVRSTPSTGTGSGSPVPLPAPAETVADRGVVALERRSSAPGPNERLVFGGGVSILASIDGAGAAPAIAGEITAATPGSAYALGLDGLFVASHSEAVGSGRGTWQRFGLACDVRRGARIEAVHVEGRLGLAISGLIIRGQSFPRNDWGLTLDPGGLAAVRIGLDAGPVTTWLELAAVFWPRQQILYVGEGLLGTALPAWDALMGVGVSFGNRL